MKYFIYLFIVITTCLSCSKIDEPVITPLPCQKTIPLSIGDYAEGGIVYSLDPCNGQGFVVSTTDQAGYAEVSIEGLNLTCNNLILNGYSDWKSPSHKQLILISENINIINESLNNNGYDTLNSGVSGKYISNTNCALVNLIGIFMSNGEIDCSTTTSTYLNAGRIRAIRSFNF